MKRLISLVLTILLIVALCSIFVACGDVFVKPDDNNQSNVGDNNDGDNNGSNSGEDNGGNETPLIFTINFESNGGSEVASFTAEDGDIIVAPTIPTREGYTFVGWYIDKDLTKLWDFSKDVVSGTITLYAKWSADAGKIIAFENGLIDGSYIEVVVDEKTDSLAIEKSVTLGGSGIWKLYYDIMGQVEIPTKIATQTNGKLNDGDNIFYIVSSTYDGSQVFTYKLNVHRQYMTTVDFMFNDETIKTVELLTKTVIPAYEVPKANAVTGYTISGWTQTVDEEEVDFVTATDKVQKATILHSVHTANTYTVTLDADGGTVDKSTYTLTYDRSYSLNVPTKTECTFEGWYYGSTRCTYDDGDSNGYWKIANDVTLTAKWQINEYEVTANKNISEAGNVSGGGYHDYQSMVTLTATTNKGYIWLGWYDGDTKVSEGADTTYTFVMTEESVLYVAKWQVAPEMTNFVFTSTSSSCHVTGIKDKTLTSIIVPSYVTEIDGGAFEGCSSLESLTLPFVGANAEDTFNTNFGYIFGASAFNKNDIYVPASLKTVEITSGKNIAEYAFRGCSGLTSITIPDDVTSIGYGAFSGCTSLESITVESGNAVYHSEGNCLIKTASKALEFGCKNSVIPTDGSVTSIGYGAFSGCSGLTSISIPASVTSIGGYAFYDCSNLSSVTFGENSQLTSIGGYAFYDCSNLSSVTFGENSQLTSIGEYAFDGCSSLTSITIPAGVTSIGVRAFSDCSSLTSITIPDGVTSIGYRAFSGCSNLSSVTFGENSQLTSIGEYAFDGCSNLSSVTFGENSQLTSIGGYAFSGCSGLTSITIPDDVTSIGDNAFSGCSGLTSITIPDDVTSIGYGAFSGCSGLTSITIPDSVTSIGSFSGCSGLTSITIPDGVTSIGYRAFSGCSGLTSISIPASVTSIGGYAFYDCSNLTSITIPASVTSIGVYAFDGCSNLSSVTFGENSQLTSIENLAFSDCSSLTSITIPAGVTSIGVRAFYGCSNLSSVTFGENSQLTSIENLAFYRCSGLTSISIPASVTSIGDNAFDGCSNLSSVTFGENSQLTSIGEYTFDDCSSLTSITIPDDVTSIGNGAFSGCWRLTSITIPDDVTSIGGYAFYDCSNLTSITIPASVTSIGVYAFHGCSSLKTVYNYSKLVLEKGSTSYGYVACYAENVYNY